MPVCIGWRMLSETARLCVPAMLMMDVGGDDGTVAPAPVESPSLGSMVHRTGRCRARRSGFDSDEPLMTWVIAWGTAFGKG